MTVLSACSDAAIALVGRSLSSLFSSTNQFERELQYLANETATAIARQADWRAITKLHTLTGDGTTSSFSMPSDYDRMPIKASVYSTRSQTPLNRVTDTDQWLDFNITGVFGAPGYWIVLGGLMQIMPALASGENAKFYYISNQIVSGSSGSKTAFTADADTFFLPDRLLTLGLIWRWRALKRLEYAEDLRNFEIALSEAAGRDKGSRVLAIGRPRIPTGVTLAFSGGVGNGGIDASSGSITADNG